MLMLRNYALQMLRFIGMALNSCHWMMHLALALTLLLSGTVLLFVSFPIAAACLFLSSWTFWWTYLVGTRKKWA